MEKRKMHEKLKNILDHLVAGIEPPICNGMPLVTGYKEAGPFIKLETDLPDRLQILLKYEAGNDAYFDSALRIEAMILFGRMDVSASPQTTASQLLRILAGHNQSSLSTSFIGIIAEGEKYYLTQNSALQFLMGWDDSEIAIVLSTCLTNLIMASAQKDPSLTMLKTFWQ